MSTWSPSVFILVVEDNVADAYLIQRAIRAYGLDIPLLVVDDGEEAIRWIESTARTAIPAPQAVVLDLNLPRRNGMDILERLRSTRRFRDLPVVIFSSYITEQDLARAAADTSTRFLHKPSDLESFTRIGSLLKDLIHQPAPSPHRA